MEKLKSEKKIKKFYEKTHKYIKKEYQRKKRKLTIKNIINDYGLWWQERKKKEREKGKKKKVGMCQVVSEMCERVEVREIKKINYTCTC